MRDKQSTDFNEIELEAKDGATVAINGYGACVEQSEENVFKFTTIGMYTRIARIVGYPKLA